MQLHPKFIIEDNEIILGKVQFHRHLAWNEEYVKSGGWFRYDRDTNTMILYGHSEDFGRATLEQIKKAIQNKVYSKARLRDLKKRYNFAFSNEEGYYKIPKNQIEITPLWDQSEQSYSK